VIGLWWCLALVRALRVTPAAAPLPSRRAVLGAAGAVVTGASATAPQPAVAAPAEVRSPRPLAWRIAPGDPPSMQPYTGRAVESCLGQISSVDAVFLGVKRGDAADYALAAKLIASLQKKAGGRTVAVGMDAAPLGSGPSLASGSWPNEAAGWPAVGGGDPSFLAPLLDVQRSSNVELVPLGIAGDAMAKVQRAGGIRSLSETERAAYVDDVSAFVKYAALPGFDAYTKRVVERRYARDVAGKADAPSFRDYFASAILQDEAAATGAAVYLRKHPGALIVCVVDEARAKFGYGAVGRARRLEVDFDDPATKTFTATAVLLNPTANTTLSTTTQLRLALAVDKPANAPVADYVFFSESPRVNLITHMLNPIDGQFKIDLGLSMPTQ